MPGHPDQLDPDHPDAPACRDYEEPDMIELGSVVELARGYGEEDTADMKQWYN
jgi:hypothetical protein